MMPSYDELEFELGDGWIFKDFRNFQMPALCLYDCQSGQRNGNGRIIQSPFLPFQMIHRINFVIYCDEVDGDRKFVFVHQQGGKIYFGYAYL